MKSCNTKKRKPKRKTFKLIKKKPTVAEEFFSQIYKPLETLFSSMHGSRRARTLNSLSVSCHRHTLAEMTQTKGKAAGFFGRFYWPTGKQAPETAPLNASAWLRLLLYFNPSIYSSLSYLLCF